MIRFTEIKRNSKERVTENSTRKYMNKNILRAMFFTGGMLFAACTALTFSGCGLNEKHAEVKKQEDRQEASGTGVYFDTVVDIRVFGEDAEELLQGCFALCEEAELTLSAHKEGSELYRLNHRNSESAEVSEELAVCISRGLEYAEMSEGKFDITILPLRELWDFEAEDAAVPEQKDIDEALAKVDYRKVHVDGTTVTFDDPETQIDLGGIAKGYISGKLKQYLAGEGCTSALINLGGNVSVLGTKPDGSSWNVGIQEPFADRGTVFETVEIGSGCVISSGTYERYFEQDGELYHHILDPETGRPVITDLQQASVVGEEDILCDAFSTICILAGKEEAEQIAERNGLDVRIFFVGEDHEGTWYPQE